MACFQFGSRRAWIGFFGIGEKETEKGMGSVFGIGFEMPCLPCVIMPGGDGGDGVDKGDEMDEGDVGPKQGWAMAGPVEEGGSETGLLTIGQDVRGEDEGVRVFGLGLSAVGEEGWGVRGFGPELVLGPAEGEHGLDESWKNKRGFESSKNSYS